MREFLFHKSDLITFDLFRKSSFNILIDIDIGFALIFRERTMPKERFGIKMLSDHK
jgi:hypothetical protein